MTELLTNPSAQYIRDHVLWRARLNDDRVIYQYDIEDEPSSWLKLKRYLDVNRDKYIVDLYLMFRDHYEFIGSDARFFFFSYKLLGHVISGYHQGFYIGGCGNDVERIHCKHFVVPELLLTEEDVRDGKSAICNRGIIAHPDYIALFEKYHDDEKI